MNHTHFLTILYVFFLLPQPSVVAQIAECRLQDPVVTIDFGIGNTVRDVNATRHPNYERVKNTCPPDGFYSYTGYTSSCFNNDWFTIEGDHSGNGGNMMLVNASENGGSFFSYAVAGLKPATRYEFAAWLTNVCRINGGCSPLPPNILVTVKTLKGRSLAAFVTGQLVQSETLRWKRYAAFFTTPAPGEAIILTMTNQTLGGCGNDFAMDDLTLRECVPLQITKRTVRQELPVKPVKDVAVVAKKETNQPRGIAPKAIKPLNVTGKQPLLAPADTVLNAIKRPVRTTVNAGPPSFQKTLSPGLLPGKTQRPLPDMLTKRESTVASYLKTPAGTLTVDLYDNGQVDGDTVTIFHNNQLVVAGARLSGQPISFSINIDETQPHHELVMVANNLGSIPPNTSLMIIKVNGRRYDVFISSTEQKNARVIIDLEQKGD